MDLALQLAFLGLLGGALWLALQPRYVFVIRVGAGGARVGRGKVTAAFVHEVADVCRRHGVRRGWVGGVRAGGRVALRFSRGLPPACRQQLRNAWAAAP